MHEQKDTLLKNCVATVHAQLCKVKGSILYSQTLICSEAELSSSQWVKRLSPNFIITTIELKYPPPQVITIIRSRAFLIAAR